MAAMACLIVAFEANRIILSFSLPIVLISGVPVSTTLTAGAPLVMDYKIGIRRDCRYNIFRFVYAMPGNEVVWRDNIPGAGGPAATEIAVRNAIPLPLLAPGQYEFLTLIHSDCIEGTHTTRYPRLAFQVTP